jgi:hypothetical protein
MNDLDEECRVGSAAKHDAEAPSSVRGEGHVKVDLDLVAELEGTKERRVRPDPPRALGDTRSTFLRTRYCVGLTAFPSHATACGLGQLPGCLRLHEPVAA